MVKAPLFVAIFIFIALCSCQKSGDSKPNPAPSELKTDSTALSFIAEAGAIDSFSIFYDGSWSMIINPSNSSWLKTNVVSGTGDTKIYVSTEEKNTTGGLRTATLVIKPGDNNAKSVNVSVTQAKERQWAGVGGFPGVERVRSSAFVIGEKFYVGLGHGFKGNKQQDLNDFYEFNSVTNTWRQIADFPGGDREHASGFSLNGKGYIALGREVVCPGVPGFCDFNYFKDFWEYDPVNNSWKQVGNFDFLSSNGVGITVFAINNKAYLNMDGFIWEFDPQNYSLTKKGPSPPLVFAAAFTLNNKGYVGTFINFGRDFYEYDPQTDSWTRLADFGGEGRYGAFAFSINGRGFLGGGMGRETIGPGTTQEVRLKDVWEFDPQTNSWQKFSDFPSELVFGVAGVLNGNAIVGTGNSTNIGPFNTKEFWIY